MDTGEYEIVKLWNDELEVQPFRQGERRVRQIEAAAREQARKDRETPQPPAPAKPELAQKTPPLFVRLLLWPLAHLLTWVLDRIGAPAR